MNVNSIKLDITNKCNLNCLHWYNYENSSKEDNLSLDQFINMVNVCKKFGLKEIDFAGREPLMRKDILKLVEYVKKSGLICSITSNCTLLTKDISKRLIDLKLDVISFSLDGCCAETNDLVRGKDTYNKVIKNINKLNEIKEITNSKEPKLQLNFTMNSCNINEMRKLEKIVDTLKVDILILSIINREGNAKKNDFLMIKKNVYIKSIETLFKHLKDKKRYDIIEKMVPAGVPPLVLNYLNFKYKLDIPILYEGCYIGKSKNFYVNADGNIHICQLLFKSINKRQKDITLDELIQDPEDVLLNKFNYYEEFVKNLDDNFKNNKNFVCYKCPFKNKCKMCPAYIGKGNYEILEYCKLANEYLTSYFNRIIKSKLQINFRDDCNYKIKDNEIIIDNKINKSKKYLKLNKNQMEIINSINIKPTYNDFNDSDKKFINFLLLTRSIDYEK